MAHEAQVRYSNLVDLKLRATLVKKVGVICNNRYEGSPKAGSVKVPVRDTEVSVNDYNKQTGAEKTHGDTAYLTVAINKDKAVNEIIDGFDAESVPGNLVADRLDSAGYSLGLQMDSDGSVELTTAPKRSLSAPSARRATRCFPGCTELQAISIHALREEGDQLEPSERIEYLYFYPRPPRGGRLLCDVGGHNVHGYFYPRPPRGGRPGASCCAGSANFYFYPRPPRGGRRSPSAAVTVPS